MNSAVALALCGHSENTVPFPQVFKLQTEFKLMGKKEKNERREDEEKSQGRRGEERRP